MVVVVSKPLPTPDHTIVVRDLDEEEMDPLLDFFADRDLICEPLTPGARGKWKMTTQWNPKKLVRKALTF